MREVDLEVFAAELAAGAFVLDVREPDEYLAGHVPGVHSAPLSAFDSVPYALPTGGPVYVICASGNRSLWAAAQLVARGVDALSVTDGTAGWARTGRPLVGGADA
ncbi:rhodanese-like domain-containing protein [Streptomyces sp. NPDC014685]|uniref:rhodanese-like domain-containing protein n=1 Tax=Streptomyces sp. NPDC014685 TaxID=3364881 RepID=UPI0036F96130